MGVIFLVVHCDLINSFFGQTLHQTFMKQFDVCRAIQTLRNDKGGQIIAENSQIVILAFLGKGMVKVCRFGYYLESLVVKSSLIKKDGK